MVRRVRSIKFLSSIRASRPWHTAHGNFSMFGNPPNTEWVTPETPATFHSMLCHNKLICLILRSRLMLSVRVDIDRASQQASSRMRDSSLFITSSAEPAHGSNLDWKLSETRRLPEHKLS